MATRTRVADATDREASSEQVDGSVCRGRPQRVGHGLAWCRRPLHQWSLLDERGGRCWVGLLDKGMYGTRTANLIWRATVHDVTLKLGFMCCSLQPGVYVHHERDLGSMIHVDQFLLAGNFHEV